jgi:hypothetical protein
MRRPSLVAVVLAGAAAAVVFLRRRKAARAERVDLYYEDGSMISLEDGTPEAERLLAVARDAVRGVAS